MRRLFLVASLFATIRFAQAQAPFVMEWQRHLGAMTGGETIRSVEETSDGGYLLTGQVDGNGGDASGHHGGGDCWVVKLDAGRNIQWQICLGGTAADAGQSAIEMQDGSFVVAGYTTSSDGDVTDYHGGLRDARVIKLAADGTVVWKRCYGGSSYDSFFDAAPAPSGGVMLVGSSASSNGDLTFDPFGPYFWVVELNSDGDIVWQDRLGGSGLPAGDEVGRTLVATSDGGYLLAGEAGSNDGDVIGNHGDFDVWLLKLDAAHELQWQKCLGGTGYEYPAEVIELDGGGYAVAARAGSNDGDVSGGHGWNDVWTVRLDTNGDIVWQTCSGGSVTDAGFGIRQLPDGTITVLALTNSTDGDIIGHHGGGSDFWVLQLDALNGSMLSSQCFGGSDYDDAKCCALASDGGFIIGGYPESADGDILGPSNMRFWFAKLTADCNFARGTLFIDSDTDGVLDGPEARLAYHPVTTDALNAFTWANSQGEYSTSFLDPGTFQVMTASIDNYTPMPASHAVSFSGGNETSNGNDFAFQPVVVANDLNVSLICNSPFRPGFDAVYSIHYENVGTSVLDPTLTLDLDADLSYVSASLVPASVEPLVVQWQLPSLAPFGTGDITVLVHVDAPTIGIAIDSEVNITPVIDDATPADNVSECTTVTTGSYDPNDITVDRSSINVDELVDPPYLEYLVRFQNTGTDTAFVVRLENNFPEELDVPTLEILSASHPADVEYIASARRLVFRFDNILLPDSGTNEMLSHGYVRYRVKPREDLAVGDSVLVNASIFFDFNAPVLTNTAFTVVELPTLTEVLNAKNDLLLYPNPTSGELFVKVGARAINARVVVRDATGQEVLAEQLSSGHHRFNLGHLASGLYVVSFQSEHGVESHRILVH